jgi:hypothetical protein
MNSLLDPLINACLPLPFSSSKSKCSQCHNLHELHKSIISMYVPDNQQQRYHCHHHCQRFNNTDSRIQISPLPNYADLTNPTLWHINLRCPPPLLCLSSSCLHIIQAKDCQFLDTENE